jgi:hypothetical protein
MLPPPEEKKVSGYPRGWKFMSEFVDKDGNVYHKGELQPELFGNKRVNKRKKKENYDRR